MSENTRPDQASGFDDDIPAFSDNGSQAATSATNVYNKAGRAAPQSIAASESQTEVFVQPSTEETVVLDTPQPAKPVRYEEPAFIEEPLAAAPVAEPAIDTTPVYTEQPVAGVKRGTTDFGIFIVRIVLALYLLAESISTFFQLGRSPGLNGLEKEFASYALPEILAIAVPTMQLAAGVFLLLGLVTPVAAAIATVVTTFMAIHAVNTADSFNILNPTDSVWLGLILMGISVAVQFTGPGRISFDTTRSWATRPLVSSWLFAIIGVAGAVALWWFGAGVNPLN